MITYEQAKQTAKELLSADTVLEYPDAYVFTNSKAVGDDQEDNELVILKQNGNIISYFEYLSNSKHSHNEVQAKLIV